MPKNINIIREENVSKIGIGSKTTVEHRKKQHRMRVCTQANVNRDIRTNNNPIPLTT
jgi:hypothetical protein